jgi:antiviral helicase SKI2
LAGGRPSDAERIAQLTAEVAALRAALSAALPSLEVYPPATASASLPSQLPPPLPPPPSAAQRAAAGAPPPRHTVKVHPAWPLLSRGSDEIQPMSFLHGRLLTCGYALEAEEAEDWFFGASTHEAVATLQACARPPLPETGVMCAATWAALGLATGEWDALAEPPPWQKPAGADSEDESVELMELVAAGGGDSDDDDGGNSGGLDNEGEEFATFHSQPVDETTTHHWPPIRRDDGGGLVAALQALLERRGYYANDDETMYWTFGLSTEAALRTFQASEGLVDTGVVDGATWRALVGEQLWTSGPAAVMEELVDPSRDMAQDGVWLIGEGRWERRL